MLVYDVIVIGVGGMGSAAVQHLAQRGRRVLGIDQFNLAHDRGSSHGHTRIIRRAYFEHPDYVPLLNRAYTLWADLERESGRTLFARCGLLLAGPPGGAVMPGLRRSATIHGVPIEPLNGDARRQRFSAFHLPADRYDAAFEPDAGYLLVENCVRAACEVAHRADATFAWNHRVLGWSPEGRGIRVSTNHGAFAAHALVICGGPWSELLLPSLPLPLTVRRKVQLWFAPRDDRHRVENGGCVFGVETDSGFYYGFPEIDTGRIKIAHHTGGQSVALADRVDRTVTDDDITPVRRFIAEHLPGVTTDVVDSSVCLYTMTPDEHFIIDRHPDFPNVCYAAGFSGHGFKFASIVGSVLADLTIDGWTRAPIGFLSAKRPALRNRPQ